MKKQYINTLTLLVMVTMAWAVACAQPPDDDATTPDKPDDPRPAITTDREAKTIDLAATMVPAEPQWLELIATSPGPTGRQHEAIVTVTAKPSHIHLALVTLGLTPGHPLINKRQDDQIVTDPPTGPALELFFVYEKDGKTHETPVHEWVLDAQTGEPLPPARWLFTGSVFRQWQDREYYMADEAGNVASLVNFGDDLIVRQTDTTQDTDFQQLQINKAEVLPYGTELILRIRVARPADGDENPAEPSDKPTADGP